MFAQLDDPVEAVKDVADRLPAGTIGALAALAVVLLACYGAWRLLRRRARPAVIGEEELPIDVDALSTECPPAEGPSLAYYGQPTRLAALVLAPAGRDRQLPPFDRLDEVLEHIVPGFSRVHLAHKPVFRRWPNQLSVHGFAHKYFARVRLAADRGRAMPWCSVAGVFKIEGQPYLVGMLLRTATPTNLGQKIVDDATQWLGMLRVGKRD
jgi:hypothetical protein